MFGMKLESLKSFAKNREAKTEGLVAMFDGDGDDRDSREGFKSVAEMRIPEGIDEDEDDEIDKMGGVNREEEREGKNVRDDGVWGFFSLDF